MAFAGGVGVDVQLAEAPYRGPEAHRLDSVLLFAESNSRFLVEVEPRHAERFEALLTDLPVRCIGETADSEVLQVAARNGETILAESLAELKSSWQTPLVPH
jgi:phosphoribosylformylglycinamidine synthase